MKNIWVLLLILILDRLSKLWVQSFLKIVGSLTLIPGVFELRYAQNTGMAFSLFNDRPDWLLWLITFTLGTIIFWSIKSNKLSLSMAFILAGGLGNLTDRFLYGYVVDFINPLFVDFAIFNIADIALNIGVIILIIESLRK